MKSVRTAVRAFYDAPGRLSIRVRPPLGRTWGRWTHRVALDRASRLAPIILSEIATPNRTDWQILDRIWTHTDTVVLTLGRHCGQPSHVLKLPQTEYGVASLRRQERVLTHLIDDKRLGDWRRLLPWPITGGMVDGQYYLLEPFLAGRNARSLLHDSAATQSTLSMAVQAISHLHRVTGISRVADAELLRRWVDQPMKTMTDQLGDTRWTDDGVASLMRLQSELYRQLLGRTVRTGWIHGDYWVGNLLVNSDRPSLIGIVDWERSTDGELAWHDLVHLLVTTRALQARKTHVGTIVGSLLRGSSWTTSERTLLERAGWPSIDDPAGTRAMLLLYWLRYVTILLVQYPRAARNDRWMAANFTCVLETL